MKKPREQLFWPKVKKGAPDECWLWMGAISRGGYGRFGGRPGERAHRFSWRLANGMKAIPDGMVVMQLHALPQ